MIDDRAKRASEIADGNDRLRKAAGSGQIGGSSLGRVVLTAGVANSGNLPRILQRVAEFDDFKSGDDPYGERDFGAFTVDEGQYMFKIDYYTPDMNEGADPYDDSEFLRVLTLLLTSEY